MRSELRLLLALTAMAALIAGQDVISPGTYKGSYAGGAGSGDFHIALKVDGSSGMSATVGFTIMGEEVPAKITSLKVSGAKIEISYDFELQGAKLTSAADGVIKGKTIEGQYTTSAEGQAVDQGTWKATLQ